MKRLALILLGFVVVIGLAGGGAYFYGRARFHAPGPLAAARNVVVVAGSLAAVAEQLEHDGVIEDAREFRVAASLTKGEGGIRSAELAFPSQASLQQVLAVLRTGKPVQHLLTIPEGLTVKQIALLLEKTESLTGAPQLVGEASILPETYAYEYGMARAAIVERGRRALTRAMADLWEKRSPGLPISSPAQALILASIVERETSKADERPHVAAVFYNRMRLGMKLQSDPTVVYAASQGLGSLDRPISRADLDRDDPYNTYKIAGLPPSAICAPGLASIRAVLSPAKSEDLYFVADGSGGHVFARTLEEHNRNVAKWRARSSGGTN